VNVRDDTRTRERRSRQLRHLAAQLAAAQACVELANDEGRWRELFTIIGDQPIDWVDMLRRLQQ